MKWHVAVSLLSLLSRAAGSHRRSESSEEYNSSASVNLLDTNVSEGMAISNEKSLEQMYLEYTKNYPASYESNSDYCKSLDWYTFCEAIFKADSAEFYEKMFHEPVFGGILRRNLYTKIIEHDAGNILSSLELDVIQEIALDVTSITKYAPTKIIKWVVSSVPDLKVDTRHIVPLMIKSPQVLQYLFHVGYNQLPEWCLKTQNDPLIIRKKCAIWLAKRNALPLMNELFRQSPNHQYNYGKLAHVAIGNGSLDVLKWLAERQKIAVPWLDLAKQAVDRGQLEIVKWMLDKLEDQIDWKVVAKQAYYGQHSHRVMEHFQKHTKFPLSLEGTLGLFASNGDLVGLTEMMPKKSSKFHWEIVAKYAAQAGHIHVLEWVYENSKTQTLPTAADLEDTCVNGHLGVLRWIHKLQPNVPYDLKVYAVIYLYKAAQNFHVELMEWILDELLDGILPSMAPMYISQKKLREHNHLRVLRWIANHDPTKMEPTMMLRAAEFGHAGVVRWLANYGQIVTVEAAKRALSRGRTECLEVMYEIDSSSVCNMSVLDYVTNKASLKIQGSLNWVQNICGSSSSPEELINITVGKSKAKIIRIPRYTLHA